MEKLKAILTSTIAKRFYWTTANGFIGLAITYLTGTSYYYTPFLIAILNGATKELNNYLSE